MTIPSASLTDLDALAGEEPFVRALAKSLIFDDATVDDVVQQTWIEVLRHGLPPMEGRRAWLARVVRSRASNERRGRLRRDRREREAAEPEAVASPAEMLERAEQRRAVVAAVAALAEPYRTTIMLRYFEGHAPQAIARAQSVPVETVQTRLKRARALLRERFDQAHGGDRRRWQLALLPLAAAHRTVPGSVLAWFLPLLVIPAMKTLLFILSAALLSLWLHQVALGPSMVPDPVEVATTKAGPGQHDTVSAEVDGLLLEPPLRSVVEAADEHQARSPAGLDPTQQAVLTGRLVDVFGAPASGRRCRLLCVDPVRWHAGGFDPGQQVDGAFLTAHESLCDEDGVFRFAGVPAGQSHALWLGYDGANARLHVLPFALPAGRTTDLGVLGLQPRGGITGRVVDRHGAPIAGARVRALDIPGALLGLAPVDRLQVGGALMLALPHPQPFLEQEDGAHAYVLAVRRALSAIVPTAERDAPFAVLPFPDAFDAAFAALPIPQAVTGGDGRFRLEGLVDGEHALLVDTMSHARAVLPRVSLRGGILRDAGDLRVDDGEEISCHVVDGAGTPVPGAEVRLALRPSLGLSGVLFAEPVQRTDAAGHCAFTGLPRGRYVVAFRRGPGAPWLSDVTTDSGSHCVLRLPQTTDVFVRVVDPAEAPVADVRFHVHQGPWLGEASVASMHQSLAIVAEQVIGTPGLYRLKEMTPGVYTLGVEAPSHAFTQQLLVVEADPMDADEPEMVRLKAGVDLEVQVVDQAGAPVPGAEIFVAAVADLQLPFSQSILTRFGSFHAWPRLMRTASRTDADGRTRVHGLPTGGADLMVRHRARGTVGMRYESLPAAARITLPPPGSVAGTVRVGGVPADPATMRLDVRPMEIGNGGQFPHGLHGIRIDAQGVFAVDGLAPGRYQLTLAAKEDVAPVGVGAMLLQARAANRALGSPDSRVITVEVEAGATTSVDLDLDPLSAAAGAASATLHGRVVLDGRGKAAVGIKAYSLRLHGSQGQRPMAVTDAEGHWSRTGLIPGPMQLLAQLSESPHVVWSKSAAAGVGPSGVDFVTATVRLDVEVHTAAGTPSDSSRVVASGTADAGGEVMGSTTTDAAGRASLQLPAGSYSVLVDGRDGRARTGVLPLSTASRQTVVLSEDRLLRATLAVHDSVHVNVVSLQRADKTSSFRTIAVDGGRTFTMTDVEPGTWQVELWTRSGQFHAEPRTIEVAGQGATEVVLRLGQRK